MIENKYIYFKFSDKNISWKNSYLENFFLSNSTQMPNNFNQNEEFIMEGYFIGFCIKGKARIKINFREFEVFSGSLLILFPKQIIQRLEFSEDYFLKNMFFSTDFFLDIPLPPDIDLLMKIGKHPSIKISDNFWEKFMVLYNKIESTYLDNTIVYQVQIIKALLSTLIFEIMNYYKTNEFISNDIDSKAIELTFNFFQLIIKHIKEERNVSFYADKLCITAKHLSRTVRNISGQTVNEWITTTALLTAKILLRHTVASISQISDELNFLSASSFGRFFKEQTGITPLEYRNAVFN